MGWVRKTDTTVETHECAPPERMVTFRTRDGEASHSEQAPDGVFGDLWRCDCGVLWRIGNACDMCDPQPPDGRTGQGRQHPGLLHGAVSTAWRRATWWQRLIYMRD